MQTYVERDVRYVVVDRGRATQLCVVKLATTIGRKHYEGLARMATQFPQPRLCLVSMYPDRLALDPLVENVPFGAIADIARGA